MKIKPAGDNSIYQSGLPYFNNTLVHDYQSDINHKYISFSEGPRVGAISEAAFLIIEQFFGKKKGLLSSWDKICILLEK